MSVPGYPEPTIDGLVNENMELRESNRKLRIALGLALSAMQKNIAYATRKDEPALAEAIPVARAALKETP